VSRVLTELRRLGYAVSLDGEHIRCRLVGRDEPSPNRALAVLRAVRARHADVLAALRTEVAEGWPEESARCEGRFGHRAARLYPLLGQMVESPKGRARLVQVGSTTCRVVPEAAPDRTECVPLAAVRPVRTGGSTR
jgi:hypothetical protein